MLSVSCEVSFVASLVNPAEHESLSACGGEPLSPTELLAHDPWWIVKKKKSTVEDVDCLNVADGRGRKHFEFPPAAGNDGKVERAEGNKKTKLVSEETRAHASALGLKLGCWRLKRGARYVFSLERICGICTHHAEFRCCCAAHFSVSVASSKPKSAASQYITGSPPSWWLIRNVECVGFWLGRWICSMSSCKSMRPDVDRICFLDAALFLSFDRDGCRADRTIMETRDAGAKHERWK